MDDDDAGVPNFIITISDWRPSNTKKAFALDGFRKPFGEMEIKELQITFTANATGKLDILCHDGDTLRVDGTKIDIFKERNKISLRGLLKSTNGGRLEAKIGLEALSDFTNKTLEGELANEKLSGLLVATNFTKSNRSWSVTMRLLDSSCNWRTLTSSLCSKLFAGCFSSGGFASSLLGSNHDAE